MRKTALLMILPALVLLTVGWANGPNHGNGFGTHDWVFNKAWDSLGRPQWLQYKAARRTTDDPDTVIKDFSNHAYDIWGAKRGHGPRRVKELFDQAVAGYKSGDLKETSRLIGLMSHYYADLCNPLQTDDSPGEKKMRSSYVKAVNRMTDQIDETTFSVVFDGRDYVKDPKNYAKRAAVLAHKDYATLVGEYNLAGFDATVAAITQRSLNRAANGIADLIYSVRKRGRADQRVVIETDRGRMVVKLFPRVAPITVDNFKSLITRGFYTGLTFHRVVPKFVVQGGDPKGDGTGGPGYTIPAEFNSKPHLRGTVGMARSADPNSGGSQFYICLEPQPSLDGNYTVFGQVVEGLDVLDQIQVGDIMRRVYLDSPP